MALGFTRKRSEFELLETEKGAPGFFGGWRYAEEQRQEEKQTVAPSLSENIGRIKESFRADINPDIIIRRFAAGGRVEAAVVFMNGMADAETINDYVLRETMKKPLPDKPPYIDYMIKNVLTAGDVSVENDWYKVKRAITDGQTVMFVGNEERAAIIDTRGYEHRSVGTTENEKVVRGPQEGFNENLRTNITLLRRMIRREDLVCEIREMDVQNHIRAAIVYLDGSANPALVQEVKRRIAGVQTRMMSNIGVLEQLTENHPLSPFPPQGFPHPAQAAVPRASGGKSPHRHRTQPAGPHFSPGGPDPPDRVPVPAHPPGLRCRCLRSQRLPLHPHRSHGHGQRPGHRRGTLHRGI